MTTTTERIATVVVHGPNRRRQRQHLGRFVMVSLVLSCLCSALLLSSVVHSYKTNENDSIERRTVSVHFTDGTPLQYYVEPNTYEEVVDISSSSASTEDDHTVSNSNNYHLRSYNPNHRSLQLASKLITSTAPIRINCGNVKSDFIDSQGNKWFKDTQYVLGGNVYDGCALVKQKDGVTLNNRDCTFRYGTFLYQIPVPSNGQYTVTLYFTELSATAKNLRQFDIQVEGQTVVNDFDLFALYGRINPVTVSQLVTVTDGRITIASVKVVGNPILSGISIVATESINNNPVSSPVSTPTTPSSSAVIRINCGSNKNWTNPRNGNIWTSDVNYVGGGSYSIVARPIAGTELDQLFYDDRFWAGPTGTVGSYKIPVSPGRYVVRLLFVESFISAANQRIFNVTVQGRTVKSNLDLYSIVGKDRVYVVTTFVSVSFRKTIQVDLTNIKQNAVISAIEIIKSDAPTTPTAPVPVKAPTKRPVVPTPKPIPLPTGNPVTRPPIYIPPTRPIPPFPLRINCGELLNNYTDSLGRIWVKDVYNLEGWPFQNCPREIQNTDMDPLFCTERYFDQPWPGEYDIPTGPGKFFVRLWFAETFFTAEGKRVFNVGINGITIKTRFDIYKEVGANKPVSLSATVSVSAATNRIKVQLSNIANWGKVNAIEIVKL